MGRSSVTLFCGMFTAGILSFLTGVTAFYQLSLNNISKSETQSADSANEAVLGRALQIPARDYIIAFNIEAPKLGDCALKMHDGKIKICKEKFKGEEIFIPKALTEVGVSRIETADDILKHGMGGIGLNVGVLGLAGIGWKTNVAVTTETSSKHLTIMSSYDLQKGILTLQNPQPLTEIGPDGALYLSEIELGGNEVFMVTMEFESVQKRIDVQSALTIKILFISITAKIKYVKETFTSASKTRVQFRSSWRQQIDSTYTSLEEAVKEVERIEAMYSLGPIALSKLDVADSKIHNNYYFSAWKRSPFGESMNEAVINNDLDTLNQQNLEAQAVIHIIAKLVKEIWTGNALAKMERLNSTVTSIREQLTKGIDMYHSLSEDEKIKLRTVYGEDKAPNYYLRKLKLIAGY